MVPLRGNKTKGTFWGLSPIRVVLHQVVPIMMVFLQGGLSYGWSFIIVVIFYHSGPIMVIFYHSGLSSVLSCITVVFCRSGLIIVIFHHSGLSHQGGLPEGFHCVQSSPLSPSHGDARVYSATTASEIVDMAAKN